MRAHLDDVREQQADRQLAQALQALHAPEPPWSRETVDRLLARLSKAGWGQPNAAGVAGSSVTDPRPYTSLSARLPDGSIFAIYPSPHGA